MPKNKRAKFVAPFHRIAKKVWDIHVLVPSSRCSSLDFVSALLSACMGQRSNVLESFCWQKSRKMSWAPRWCFYKHIFWNFHPQIWGRRWSNPFWLKFWLSDGFFHTNQAIFYTTLVATSFQDQDCWLKRPYKNWQVSAFREASAWNCDKTPIRKFRTPHNSDMNISKNKKMVPFAEKLFLYYERWVFMDPMDPFSCYRPYNFAKSPKHFPLQRSRESQEIRDGKVPKSQLAGLQKRMSPWCLAPARTARTARTAKTARARMNCSSGWRFLLILYADFWICLQSIQISIWRRSRCLETWNHHHPLTALKLRSTTSDRTLLKSTCWKLRVAYDFRFRIDAFEEMPFWAHLLPTAMAQFHTILAMVAFSGGIDFIFGFCQKVDFFSYSSAVLWWPIVAYDQLCGPRWFNRSDFRHQTGTTRKRRWFVGICSVASGPSLARDGQPENYFTFRTREAKDSIHFLLLHQTDTNQSKSFLLAIEQKRHGKLVMSSCTECLKLFTLPKFNMFFHLKDGILALKRDSIWKSSFLGSIC